MRLKGKVAIITGAARGIGRVTAIRFAQEGAKVVVADFDEAGETVSKEINDFGGDSFFCKVDVVNFENVSELVKKTTANFGSIDILVNNAGITADSRLEKMTEDQWDKVIAVNLKGVFNCTRAVIPTMKQQGSGVILNATSVVGLRGNIGQTNYAATKAGLIGMTKTLAKEFSRAGIRVNAVAPGFTQTDMTTTIPEKVLENIRSQIPFHRLANPEEITAAYLFLASDEASYITGQVLAVDGGWSI
ncbi:MAG: 3-oxoacyl-ACP reductase FabG [Thermincola sp.]|nr:3-oxoacyl-ACP reductase FabG [Thermincola sp.]